MKSEVPANKTQKRNLLWQIAVMMRQWFDSDYRPPGWEGDDKLTDGIDWRRCLPFIVLHLGCLSVLWVGFSWAALVAALLLYALRPVPLRVETARVFFVWVSVFNLFAVSVFWSFMADLYASEQGKRLFGFIAAGGSAGGHDRERLVDRARPARELRRRLGEPGQLNEFGAIAELILTLRDIREVDHTVPVESFGDVWVAAK